MENTTELAVNGIMTMSAVILVIGMIFSKISRIVKLPDVVLFLIAGIIIGPSVLNLISADAYPTANQFILIFGSAYILYDGGREIKLKVLNNVKITVGLLATIGVAISAFSIGFVSMNIFNIPFIYALLIGAVIASTDPATLVPVFKAVAIKDRLKQTVISESAFNDAAGAILVFSILTIIESGKISLTHNLEELIIMILGGIFAGALVGILFSISISEGKFGLFHEFAPLVSIVAVILSYIFAEKIHGSGYMATFITGLVCGNKKTFKLWVPSEDFEIQTHVRDTLAIIMRMAIFVLLGTQVDFVSLAKYWKESLLVILALVLIVRPISVIVCTLIDRKIKWKFNEILFMMWVRETGVIPAALSGMIMSMDIKYKGILSSVVFMAILITLGIQASTTKIVAKKLNVLEDVKK
ncbi:cation:proton antiporter [Tepidibacter thalassicus]|uniref:Sodium/hydrogen exchanger family protein n=1 Tax=Tepidibacter thalassicus DSM 15285 TaxID=1123350 RepID=A0A1M5NQP8_9FIRM|nr:sodium:proton antiporter [Tepidibacter thalassicus]SHG91765.1 Sodium/hydrogen exchanger family protein [Tepidibacter thalassicus DSM 15285]